MEVRTILIFVVIIVLLYIVIRFIMKDVNTLTGITSAQTMQKIEPNVLATSSSGGNASNYTYSIWFYIDDWNYRYGESKVIFGRMTSGTGQKEPCPSAVLGPVQNNLVLSLAVYPGLDQQPQNGTNYVIHNCSIANIPIQRWVNLLVSAYGRTLDVYLDGKLVKTCILPGVAKIDASAPVYVTPLGGFAGWTSRFQYWAEPTDPQKAWNIYRAGYGGSWLSNLFGRYKIKVALIEGDKEDSSFVI